MRISRLEWFLGVLIAAVVAGVPLILWRQAQTFRLAPEAEGGRKALSTAAAPAQTPRGQAFSPVRPTPVDRTPSRDGSASQPPAFVRDPDGPPRRQQNRDAEAGREQAVAEWTRLVDRAIGETNTPVEERARQVKEGFDNLSEADREENIRHLLNLTPDDQFGLVRGILFDKSYSEAVLDAIFSDALNRSEAIKVPMMKELARDKTHPMFFESARILDATGELQNPAASSQP